MKQNIFSIAKYIVKKYKITSNLRLQKLLYFVYLKFYEQKKKLMFEEEFEAWVKGPVLRKIYNYFRDFGTEFSYFIFTSENLEGKILVQKKEIPDLDNEEMIKIIDETFLELNNLSTEELIEKSHKDKFWIEARGSLLEDEPSNNKIKLK